MSNIHNTFKTAPNHEQLRAMERALQFYPCAVGNPRILTVAQVEAFNRDGYVKGIPIFDGDEITRHRAFFDKQLEKAMAAGLGSYTISSAHLKFGKIYDLLKDPRIVACVLDLLGPEIIGMASHYFCKMPRDGTTVAWHQDASYWHLFGI